MANNNENGRAVHNGLSAAGEALRVLLVDDDSYFGELVRRKLEKTDSQVNVQQVGTCQEALVAAGTGEFDVVLMDQKLLDVSGVECIREMRGVSTCIPIIMVTGYATDELMEECMREGADDFVSKNFIDILLSHVVWSATRRRIAKKRIQHEVEYKKEQLDAIEQKLQ